MNPKVDFYFNKSGKWQEAIIKLRSIALDCQLTEVLKWGCPAYTFNGGNIVLIHVFKEYCAYLLFKGALLKDPKNILVQQTQNVQSARQIRFTSVQKIIDMETVLQSYINEAIEVEKSGLKIEFKKSIEFIIPEEFKTQLEENPQLKNAFEALTPGRQRGYVLYFSAAKQSKTRDARIQKYIDKILDGFGIDDQYS